MSRYVVGIDLGTTNSALAYVEVDGGAADASPKIQALAIPQVVGPGEVADRSILPSFLYLPSGKEFAPAALDLPWAKGVTRVVGSFARDHGAKVPGRLVGSAKSWLSHSGIDRRSPVLPWGAPDEVAKVSPVEASTAYLAHLRDAWNKGKGSKPADRLEKQEVLLTVPASFDPVARDLTIEAARAAGLENVTLLEEPQAAFYAWLASQGEGWRQRVKVGDLLLVCDVGGGTTDFTLIGVTDHEGDLALTRLSVGEHILLGGDNMDLALAHAVGATLPGGMDALDPGQRIALGHSCRLAKETLFADPTKAAAPVAILGRGSKVIGGTIKTELSRALLESTTLEGFFPPCSPDELPVRGRRVGLLEIGLPYASDPPWTRHLARFLGRQAGSLPRRGRFRPAVGGPVQRRGVQGARTSRSGINGPGILGRPARPGAWRRATSTFRWPSVPPTTAWSVPARGSGSEGASLGPIMSGSRPRRRRFPGQAGHQGPLRRSPRDRGRDRSRSPWPGVRTGRGRACRVPLPRFDDPAGGCPRPDPRSLVARRTPGTCPPRTALIAEAGSTEGDTVPVRLQANVTEVGTLELWCRSTVDDRRWKLEYNVREGRTPDRLALASGSIDAARRRITDRGPQSQVGSARHAAERRDRGPDERRGRRVVLAVEAVAPSIAQAIDEVAERFHRGGRLIYIGAGRPGDWACSTPRSARRRSTRHRPWSSA